MHAGTVTCTSAKYRHVLHSLVLRGKHDDARATLQRVHGKGVDILAAAESDRLNEEGAFRRILCREYRPYLVMAVAFPVFLNLTGVAVTAFFSPILFRTVGFESDGHRHPGPHEHRQHPRVGLRHGPLRPQAALHHRWHAHVHFPGMQTKMPITHVT
jgi:hypothetical protein